MHGKKIFVFPSRYYANCVSTTLTVSILHNVESVYFFYSNPVFLVPYLPFYQHGTVQRHVPQSRTLVYVVCPVTQEPDRPLLANKAGIPYKNCG
jgi:hypothetical protein